MVVSGIFFGVVSCISVRDRTEQTEQEGQLSPGVLLDPVEVVSDKKMVSKISSLLDNN